MAFTENEYKEMAVVAIFNYFDGEYTKEYIQDNFELAIKMIVNNAMNTTVIQGASSISENGITIAYRDDYGSLSLTSDVIALLPKKKNYRAW